MLSLAITRYAHLTRKYQLYANVCVAEFPEDDTPSQPSNTCRDRDGSSSCGSGESSWHTATTMGSRMATRLWERFIIISPRLQILQRRRRRNVNTSKGSSIDSENRRRSSIHPVQTSLKSQVYVHKLINAYFYVLFVYLNDPRNIGFANDPYF